MKLVLLAVLAIAICLPASADWFPGMDYKMHWPQTPKPGGMDIGFEHAGGGIQFPLADDWMCSESGFVTDIHFWVSWWHDIVEPIPIIPVAIFSNIPTGPDGWSIPGEMLWWRDFYEGEFVLLEQELDLQDWHDASGGYVEYANHEIWHQINIVDIPDPFFQFEGEIYWLVIFFPDNTYIGWKETDQNWNDDAVWHGPGGWQRLFNFDTGESIDFAFVITGVAATALEETTLSRVKSLY